MKNREEYMASIYAKRDARLAKRKRVIGTAASALCLILCFCAAAVAMPRMMKKTSKEVTTDITVAVNNAEGTVEKKQTQTEEFVELITMIVQYTKPIVENDEGLVSQPQKNFAYSESDFMNQRVTAFKEEEVGGEFDAKDTPKTEIAQEFADSETHKAPSVTKRPSAMGKYTSEQIIEAAYSCLTESEREVFEGIEPFVTVTRTSGGDEYYDISYKTDSAKIKITLNAENLEFIKRSGGIDNTSGTTAAPPMVVTTPAYNPDS